MVKELQDSKKQSTQKKSSNKSTARRGRPPVTKRLVQKQPIVLTNTYHPLSDIDLCLYLNTIEQSKALGLSLIDQFGNFYFLNKTACEHFEASLNNLENYSFFDLLVSPSRDKMIENLKQFVTDQPFQTTIYSKNNKRKWPKDNKNFKQMNVKQVYYRYLKSIIGRIQPVTFTRQLNQSDFLNLFQDDCWIVDISNKQFPINLFMMQTRLSSSMETFNQSLLKDPVIKRFMQRPAERKAKTTRTTKSDIDDQQSQEQCST